MQADRGGVRHAGCFQMLESPRIVFSTGFGHIPQFTCLGNFRAREPHFLCMWLCKESAVLEHSSQPPPFFLGF